MFPRAPSIKAFMTEIDHQIVLCFLFCSQVLCFSTKVIACYCRGEAKK